MNNLALETTLPTIYRLDIVRRGLNEIDPNRASIIIPVYRGGKYLGEALDSAVKQKYDNFEVIIVNDGSPDEEDTKIIGDFVRDFGDRIVYVTQNNMGISNARNRGINESDGNYLLFLDQDDILHPEAVSECIRRLDENEDLGMVYSDHVNIDKSGNWLEDKLKPDFDLNLVSQWYYFGHVKAWRRHVLEEINGFDPNYDTAEDWDTTLRTVERYSAGHIPKILYFYRKHEDKASLIHEDKQLDAARRAMNDNFKRRGVNKFGVYNGGEGIDKFRIIEDVPIITTSPTHQQ